MTHQSIKVLPDHLTNQIKAGEVVSRPCAAVKELVENAIDAGATRILVDVEDGGRKMMRVSDNGCGMTRQDAEICILRHATSKLRTSEDLFQISTLGFRGEAIPSIISVSRFTLETKRSEDLSGTRISIEGEAKPKIEEAGLADGTTVTVRDLFFNTPARLKFLKSVRSEMSEIAKTFIQLAISNPTIYMRLKNNRKTKHEIRGTSNEHERLLSIFGKELSEALYPIPEIKDIRGNSLTGFFANPTCNRRLSDRVYTFVNGRYVRDKGLIWAIKFAYQGMIPNDRHPVAILHLKVPYDQVDVNVHPKKIEVKFFDPDSIKRIIRHGVANGLARAPWVSREVEHLGNPQTLEAPTLPPVNTQTQNLTTSQNPLAPEIPKAPWESQEDPLANPDPARNAPGGVTFIPSDSEQQGVVSFGTPDPRSLELLSLKPKQQEIHFGTLPPLPPGQLQTQIHSDDFSRLRYIGHLNSTYILASDPTGLVVIDQHAAHERVVFQYLKGVYGGESGEQQQLLFPEQIELDTLRSYAMDEFLEFFNDMGFELEHFGGHTYVIKAVPALLARASCQDLIKDCLDELSAVGDSDRISEAIDGVLSRMACHASIRAGDRMSLEKAQALFYEMDKIDFKANCPHGRPVYLRIHYGELERRFKRS